MKKYVPLVFIIFLQGCFFAINTDIKKEFFDIKPVSKKTSFSDKRVYVDISFNTLFNTDNAQIERVKGTLIDVIRNTDVFNGVVHKKDNVVPVEDKDIIMEVKISYFQNFPWWNYPQLVTLCVHAVIFPTLGRDNIVVTEFSIFDKKYSLLGKWKFKYEKSYIGQIFSNAQHDIISDISYAKESIYKGLKRIEEETLPTE